jgi:hypothetical protein
MMHLRKIERLLGKDALRVLAVMKGSTEGEEEVRRQAKISKYFLQTTSQEKRDILAQEILGEKTE